MRYDPTLQGNTVYFPETCCKAKSPGRDEDTIDQSNCGTPCVKHVHFLNTLCSLFSASCLPQAGSRFPNSSLTRIHACYVASYTMAFKGSAHE